MKRILITGVTSFSGRHAVEQLAGRSKWEIHGTSRGPCDGPHLASCQLCDMRDAASVRQAISSVQPDIVLHLAASADASQPGDMLQTNVSGAWNLLEACRDLASPVQVLLVGSAACFGEMRDDETGLSSDRQPMPSSLYGISRQTQVDLGRVMNEEDGLTVFLCRTFNLIGPGISSRYVPAALATRIAAAQQEQATELSLRDPGAVRDFIDVRDAVDAYIRIIEHGRPAYPYSVGTGRPVTVRTLAETVAAELGADVQLVSDSSSLSNARSRILRSIADPQDLTADTGWSPQISLQQSVRDMLAAQSR